MRIKTDQILTHIDAELKETIVRLAQFDGRSVSRYVERVLLEHVARPDRRAALNLSGRARSSA